MSWRSLAFFLELGQTLSKCGKVPRLNNGQVKLHKGILYFSCQQGFILEGTSKVKCNSLKNVPKCLNIQSDQSRDYNDYEYNPEENDSSEYGKNLRDSIFRTHIATYLLHIRLGLNEFL